MYLITDDTQEQMRMTTLPDARTYAENLARMGRKDVSIWLLTHTCEAEIAVNWQEHAKGLSGNGG